ncbi:MAG: hypothetical protein WA918_12060 [Erythrobacter sp.]
MIDSNQRTTSLALKQSGGRGYFDPKKGGDGVTRTPITFSVEDDEAKVFDGFQLVDRRYHATALPHIAAKPFSGQRSGFRMIRFARAVDDYLHITISRNDDLEYSGFCRAKTTPQSPLSDEEAAEILK